MARIRLEWTPIKVYNLGLFGLDHLQITYEQTGAASQDEWFVLEGTKGTYFLEAIGENGTTILPVANDTASGVPRFGQDLIDYIGTPATRGSRGLPILNHVDAWKTMATDAADIEGQYGYSALGITGTVIPSLNSSSLVATVLYYVGVDIATNMPYGIRRTAGTHTLLGTQSDDELATTENFSTLATGGGNDTLSGSNANERFYGGRGDDLIHWNKGYNLIHGGQWKLDYEEDGTDTVDYTGGGLILIQRSLFQADNGAPNYIVRVSEGAVDHLYSIEKVKWLNGSDRLQLEDVEVIEDGLLIEMGGQDTPQGDRIELGGFTHAVLIDPTGPTGQMFIRALDEADSTRGTWLDSVEDLLATGLNDQIYLADTLRVVDGGAGDDLIDARLVASFTGASPQGYDAELTGGAGSDTMVAGSGRTLIAGGDGADNFVVSAMTSGASQVEIVIEGADAGDRLYIPYDFFNGSGGDYEGSQLMPVLGGIAEPLTPDGIVAFFDWRTQSQLWLSNDLSQGLITFIGEIDFSFDGSDLLVHLYKGETFTYIVTDDSGLTHEVTNVSFLPETETIVRIKSFQDGQLGIHFYDPGTPTSHQLPNGTAVPDYPNYDSIVHTITADGARLSPLADRPTAPGLPDPSTAIPPTVISASTSADTLVLANLDYRVDGKAGNDSISTGSGRDAIDGGSGADTMSGGTGNDTYIVDDAADSVVENTDAGTDLVYAALSYTLAANVENLSLLDGAVSGSGNAVANTLSGNELDNSLSGGAGDDLLVGTVGRDTLIGGAGNDRYGYTPGDGVDFISDQGSASDVDVVLINDGLTAANVTFVRAMGAPQDLLLLLSDGGRIYLEDFGVSAALSADEIRMADGTHWTRSQLQAIYAAAPMEGNAAPTPQDDASLGVSLSVVTLPGAILLANDTDPNGDALTIVGVSNAINCVVTLGAGGDITVQTPTGVQAAASFTYTVSDGHGATGTATVELAVNTPGTPGQASGTSGNDWLPGTETSDTLSGLAGDDTLVGGGGEDYLDGGAGADWASYDDALQGVALYLDGSQPSTSDAVGDVYVSIEGYIGSRQADTLVGGSGDDNVSGSIGNDSISGRAGWDTLAGGNGNDQVSGGDDDDTIYGGTGSDLLKGDAGFDLIDGALEEAVAEADTLIGGIGDDTYIVNTGDIIIEFTGEGDDRALTRSNYTLADGVALELLIAASPSVTRVMGSALGQTIANDTFSSAVLLGGGGEDILQGNGSNELLYGDFGGQTGSGVAGGDLLMAGKGNDTLYGEAGADILQGMDGDDVIYGGDDNDRLEGGAGNDTMNGELGPDTLFGGDGSDALYGQVANDSILGESGNDTIVGGWNNDTVVGGEGADSLTGNDGTDRLDGATGESILASDTLDGGAGDDTYIVQGGDSVVEAANNGTDTLIAASSYTLAQGISIESILANANAITVTGNDVAQKLGYSTAVTTTAQLRGGGAADTITGGNWGDVLYGDFAGGTGPGAAGNDSISGAGGSDTIYGEAGNDTLDAGAGYDILYADVGNDSLIGSDGFDTMYGGAGLDTLSGGNGDDWLWGDAGNDQLTGGAGTDRYMFRAGFGRDTITDRTAGELIDLQGFGATYANLVFTLTAAGVEISSTKFGTGNVIVLAGTSANPDSGQFLF